MTAHNTTLRVGLVGCGKMGLHHLAAIAKAPAAVRRVNTITTLLLEMVDRDGSPVPSSLVV